MSALAMNKKVFKNYPVLPAELRMMIVNEMGQNDRCRFTRCSTLCNKEAKFSKNLIKTLSLLDSSEGSIVIEVDFCEWKMNRNYFEGFTLRFYGQDEKKYMEYENNTSSKILWTVELEGSMDLAGYARLHFNKLLQSFQKSITRLRIKSDVNITSDFEIENFRDLEELLIRSEADPLQFLTKTRRSLDYLRIHGKEVNQIPENCKQIYKVQRCLTWPHLKLKNEQFLRLSAPYITIHIGELTVEEIYSFIKAWQNGTIEKQGNICTWELQDSDFDVLKLFKLLEADNKDHKYDNDGHCLKFGHRKDAGKRAAISSYGPQTSLNFQTFDC